ncbi:MAG TPA: homogentisate 1,2-dioxygenase [Ferrovibrio sp.]|jgi:homogentisate 1,2-dioxygenase|uniref:homogentisate 1,2-dioxygenase n=1 Tax=Ferrovibrio sp. TaxID=1917215 RepID=UPI002B4AF2FE|nr:homogentisate 1,2-dioxygenase [Ferrovibrio sp.]HLT79152.1 homogentisate 1,2-dioxygenase [Ferrovibrio sp.]
MAKTWIPMTHSAGVASRQAHVALPEGTYEREMGKEGFFGPAAHLYHRNPPTGWIDWEGPLKPRAFDTAKFADAADCPWKAKLLLGNAHVKYRHLLLTAAMDHLVRNGDGDELLFVHAGEGELFCDFGHFSYSEGDYIMLPRGTMWRLEPASPTKLLLIEATNDSYRLPDKGLLGPHAIFDPAVLRIPELDDAFKAQQQKGPASGGKAWRVVIKRRDQLSTVTYPYNPLDVVGWKGDLTAVKLNWRDIRPLMSHRYHLPPSAHTTFLASRFVVCTFVPRPIESDPEALKVPFFHNNDDYDEVIFYHQGQFFSRDNIHPGMITLHPCGFPHGPHPKAFATGAKAARKETDEVAVMLDTRDALDVAPAAESVEFKGYVGTWNPEGFKQAAE